MPEFCRIRKVEKQCGCNIIKGLAFNEVFAIIKLGFQYEEMRKTVLAIDCFYHIYNRGVEKRNIFLDEGYYSRFISVLDHCLQYNYPYSLLHQRLGQAESLSARQEILRQLERHRVDPLVKILSFCLMPNHYHLTLRQLVRDGITKFMHRVGTAYAMYFNTRQDRSGRLFESSFKAVLVEFEEQLIHLSRYQHLNPQALGLDTRQKLIKYPWSSLPVYLGGTKHFSFVEPRTILSAVGGSSGYSDFMRNEPDKLELLRLQEVAVDDDFGWFADFRKFDKEQRKELKNRYIAALLKA